MSASLLICNIGRLTTPLGDSPARGKAQGEGMTALNASLYIKNGVIRKITENGALPDVPAGTPILDAGGRLVTPGLIDAHTHLCFGGWRAHEIALKLRGADYMEIHNAGGGIADTVRCTRGMTREALFARGMGFLDEMLHLGVTACEIKSGYGLNEEDELKQLYAINDMQRAHPMDIARTFLGAHSVPQEYAGRADDYMDFLIQTVLPRAAREGLADFCDVFCEAGVFTAEQSLRLLKAAMGCGLLPKIHADEIASIGGAQAAGAVGAVSAEHLIATTDEGIRALAQGGVIACLLPQTSLYLDKPFARARAMIAQGVPVAVCTDFNPGSCPSLNLQLSLNLAYLKYRLTPAEALTAVTRNAACAIGMGDRLGTLEMGKQGDAVIWDCDHIDMLCYRMGSNAAAHVIKKGEVIV